MNRATQGNRPLRRGSLALALASLLVPLTTAKADVWTFNLFGAPAATLSEGSPGGPNETVQLTGAGKFDPDKGTIEASGSAVVFNATDHPDPPLGATLRGRWHATGFVSFCADEGGTGKVGGILVINIQFDLALGAARPIATLTIMEDGISLTNFGPAGNPIREEYESVEGSGGAGFNVHGKAESP